MIDFNGKVILVTGGSRGIGSATVKALVAAGAYVIVHYGSNKVAAEKTAQEAGINFCHLIQADLRKSGSGTRLWREALACRGHVDVLINNAGIFLPTPFNCSDPSWEKSWHDVLQVNLIAAADLCRQAIITWKGSETDNAVRGIIVNISSRAAWRGDASDQCPYAASKGGMISMMKTIARAHGGDGILCYAIAPGFVETEMTMNAFKLDPSLEETVLHENPMTNIAPVNDIANTICFLASGLAPHATGTTVDINGASYVR